MAASISTQRTVRTPDGRTLAVEEAGDLVGRPVLVRNGTPNSPHLYRPAEDAAARGLRLIGYDRPGYGGSTPRLLDDDGHLTLETNRLGEVHAWLADHL